MNARPLRLSEAAAYKRIAAARAAQRFPLIVERLAAGDVTLTTIRFLAPHLTDANHVVLLDEVRHCSTRQVEQVVARLQPRPDVPSGVRRLPAPPATSRTVPPALAPATPAQTVSPPAPAVARDEVSPSCRRAVNPGAAETHRGPPARPAPPDRPRETVAPLAPARYKVSFTISAETYAKLREAQALLRHVVPDGDVAALFDRGLTLLLRNAAKTKHAATDQPRAEGVASATPKAGSRHIPVEVKRRVWARDGGQCGFVSASGHRCTERGFLEYHHRVPYAAGGQASVDNISLRCRAHNAHEAEQVFGPRQPTLVREQASGYGRDTAREAPSHVRVREVFAVLDATHPRAWANGCQSLLQLTARPVRVRGPADGSHDAGGRDSDNYAGGGRRLLVARLACIPAGPERGAQSRVVHRPLREIHRRKMRIERARPRATVRFRDTLGRNRAMTDASRNL